MIAVIADDLTGAAELAGIGLTYGLEVELAMSVNSQSTADLLVIATDARSVSEPEAVLEMTEASKALLAMKPKLIYKKVDSVMRGHIMAETHAQLVALNLPKALLVPANPALGRTLVNGHYYVHGEPIHHTHFAEDPEFPVTESNVLKRFQGKVDQLTAQSHPSGLPDQGIVIGEVEKEADLWAWASRVDDKTLLGGGSGFFTAILDSLQLTKQLNSVSGKLSGSQLYICGTAFGKSVALVKRAQNAEHAVRYMPKELTDSSDFLADELKKWAADIVIHFREHEQVIIAIEPAFVAANSGAAIHLRTVMAMAVKEVMSQTQIDELIIEGGSTASAVLREIGVTRLVPVQELGPGVVRSAVIERAECRSEALHITMKPGSYPWPTELWTF